MFEQKHFSYDCSNLSNISVIEKKRNSFIWVKDNICVQIYES